MGNIVDDGVLLAVHTSSLVEKTGRAVDSTLSVVVFGMVVFALSTDAAAVDTRLVGTCIADEMEKREIK